MVCEPIMRVRVEVPPDTIGATLSIVGRLGDVTNTPSLHGGLSMIEATMTAAAAQQLGRQLPALTGGEGIVETSFAGYQPARRAAPIRRRTTPNPLNRKEYIQTASCNGISATRTIRISLTATSLCGSLNGGSHDCRGDEGDAGDEGPIAERQQEDAWVGPERRLGDGASADGSCGTHGVTFVGLRRGSVLLLVVAIATGYWVAADSGPPHPTDSKSAAAPTPSNESTPSTTAPPPAVESQRCPAWNDPPPTPEAAAPTEALAPYLLDRRLRGNDVSVSVWIDGLGEVIALNGDTQLAGRVKPEVVHSNGRAERSRTDDEVPHVDPRDECREHGRRRG